MRIYAVADFHGSQYRLNMSLKHIDEQSPDLVVVCGDLTQFGPAEMAMTLLNQIPVDVVAVPGNCDPFEVEEAIEKSKAQFLDQRRLMLGGIPFIGVGGMLPSPLEHLPIRDGHIEQTLEQCIDATTVLVTHVPPYKAQDRIFIGTHGGNKELRTLVERTHPRLVLCGHIHEDPGVTTIGPTTVVNCSIAKRTEGVLIDIEETVHATILG